MGQGGDVHSQPVLTAENRSRHCRKTSSVTESGAETLVADRSAAAGEKVVSLYQGTRYVALDKSIRPRPTSSQ